MHLRHMAVLVAGLLGACANDFGLVIKPDDPASNYPVIRVEPTSIDFGELTSADVHTETVKVYNDGQAVLAIDNIDLLADISYELSVAAAFPIDVAPGEGTEFDVTFQPAEGGALNGQVLIYSDANNDPEFPVPLYGLGAAPALQITPNPLKYGSRLIPCPREETFTLTNHGTEPVVIDGMSLQAEADQLEFSSAPPATLTLYQGQSWQIPVTFSPTDEAEFTAEFVVSSNDLIAEQRVPILGAAVYAASTTDVFEVPEEQPIDIMFAVDQSCSMASHQNELNSQFSSFVGVLNTAAVDWRIGVVTADHGCFNSGVITAATPNWGSVFQSAVTLGSDGTGYSLTEKLLRLAQVAMGASCNNAFRSPGAPLHIILVSDEADQSDGNDAAPYVSSYQSFAGGSILRVHSVVDLNPNGGVQCGGTPNGPGKYLNASQMTGGFLLDVCESSWPAQLASVAQSAVNDLRVYGLSAHTQVDPNSIEVVIDGQVYPTGWTYDPADIAVVFDPLPPRGSHMEISYGVTPVCP